jgi:predicted Zn-dependent protease
MVARGRGGVGGASLLIALVIAAFALFRYFGSEQINATTGEKQHIGISPSQEIALGLQATPEMENQYGGLSTDQQAAAEVQRVGNRILQNSEAGKSPYRFQFHLLADTHTVNAFALPGGQVFITEALMRRLRSEGQLAGVLAHEITHVVGRHSAEHLAKQQLTEGLTGAAVLATYDPNNPNSQRNAAIAAAIANLVNLRFSRQDELEADARGVRYMSEAGYDPRAMIGVMEVLKQATGGSGRTPDFFSTHPNPDNREGKIKQAIQQVYPNGVPEGLKG